VAQVQEDVQAVRAIWVALQHAETVDEFLKLHVPEAVGADELLIRPSGETRVKLEHGRVAGSGATHAELFVLGAGRIGGIERVAGEEDRNTRGTGR